MANYYYTVDVEKNNDGVTILVYRNKSGSEKKLVFKRLPNALVRAELENIVEAIYPLKLSSEWNYVRLFQDIFEIRDIENEKDLDSTQRRIKSKISNPSFIEGFKNANIATRRTILSEIERHIEYKENYDKTHSKNHDAPLFQIYTPKNATMSTSKPHGVVPAESELANVPPAAAVNKSTNQSENVTMPAVSESANVPDAAVKNLAEQIIDLSKNNKFNEKSAKTIVENTFKSEGNIRSALMVVFAAIVSSGLVKYWPMIRSKFKELVKQETVKRTSRKTSETPKPKSASRQKSKPTSKKHPSHNVAKSKSKTKHKK